MAITSELIGKLGGSDFESWDISDPGKNETTTIIDTVSVASGETKMLVLIGEFSIKIPDYDDTYIQIGDGERSKPYPGSKILRMAQVITDTVDVALRNQNFRTNAFTGTFYLFDL